jgi:vitellogenic carboxypeptidase-like protein
MRFVSLLLFFFFFSFVSVSAIRRGPSKGFYPDAAHPIAQSPALFLSSYLDNPKVAQEKSSVRIPGSLFGDSELSVKPFVELGNAGYITVNATTNSNTFFWFIPALNGNTSAPLLAWFNGGPGATSLYGLFEELGPFYSDATGSKLFQRNVTWNYPYSVVYVDNPVGTGWSFTDSTAGFSTNQDEIADNLYSFFVQFFTLFPQYQNNEFYICGESYAG